MKFLGVIFDYKLNWREHIIMLIEKCRKSLNVIKALAHSKWGADPISLLRIYQAVVLSRVDYACTVYSSARKSLLKLLDAVHHTGIRYCIGAFPTSPVMKLYEESGLPPLAERRARFIVNYVTGIISNPNHPNNSLLFQNQNIYTNKRTITRPLGIRFLELLEDSDFLPLPKTFSEGPSEVAPWLIPHPNVRLDLTYYNKESTPRELYVQLFNTISHEYINHKQIYTDGSKIEDGVGSAIYVDGNSHMWTLPKYSSIFYAEQYALFQALLFILMSETHKKFLIISDSLSVITSLSNLYSRDPVTQIIQATIKYLSESLYEITLLWIPSHVGISGNEIVDRAARIAASEIIPDIDTVKSSDLKIHITKQITNKYVYRMLTLTREETVKIHRLRIGHTSLTHEHLLKGEPAPNCEHCNVNLTIQHILCECPTFKHQRQINNIKANLQENSEGEENIRNTLRYLKEINLLKKI